MKRGHLQHQSFLSSWFRIKRGGINPTWWTLLLFSRRRRANSPCHPTGHPGRRLRLARCCWVCRAAPRTWRSRWAASGAARRPRGAALPSVRWPTTPGSSSVLPSGPLKRWHARINTDTHTRARLDWKLSFDSRSEEEEEEDGKKNDGQLVGMSVRCTVTAIPGQTHAVGWFEEVKRVIWSDEWAESRLRTSCSWHDNFLHTWCFKTWFHILACIYCITISPLKNKNKNIMIAVISQ